MIGGAGYAAGELIRLVLRHPDIEITFVRSNSYGGRPIYDAHPDLVGETDICFANGSELFEEIDLLFLCSGHGTSQTFLAEQSVPPHVKIVDLSSDFRLADRAFFGERQFLYGLPELVRDDIREADSIANPGCFATVVQLAMLPLAAAGMLRNSIHVNAITGSTGAGAGLSSTTHFTWRTGNVSVYKPFSHQHLDEIRQSIHLLQPGFTDDVHFLPVRGNFTRGIFATMYTACDRTEEEVRAMYNRFYADHPFTVMLESSPDLKPVVNTNKCLLSVEKHGEQLLITGVIDNLLKGAAGQAVQNANLMFGLHETTGLGLKATAH